MGVNYEAVTARSKVNMFTACGPCADRQQAKYKAMKHIFKLSRAPSFSFIMIAFTFTSTNLHHLLLQARLQHQKQKLPRKGTSRRTAGPFLIF